MKHIILMLILSSCPFTIYSMQAVDVPNDTSDESMIFAFEFPEQFDFVNIDLNCADDCTKVAAYETRKSTRVKRSFSEEKAITKIEKSNAELEEIYKLQFHDLIQNEWPNTPTSSASVSRILGQVKDAFSEEKKKENN